MLLVNNYISCRLKLTIFIYDNIEYNIVCELSYEVDNLLNGLFVNILLLISFVFVGGHIIKDVPKNIMSSIYGELLLGIAGGLLGILLMVYTIPILGTQTILDLRVLAILMVSWLGGLIPITVTSAIIAAYRVAHYGINISSITAGIQIAAIAISVIVINRKVAKESLKWFSKLLISLIILIITLGYLLINVENFLIIILQYAIVYLAAGVLVYILLNYVKTSNDLYKMYRKDSTKDFLTGLNNTRQFDKLLNEAYKRAIANSEKLSCLMIDIDHFKRVNDTYGHAIGDIVLKELADILKIKCRTFDIVGRIGGEEFCVLLPDCPKDHAAEVAWRIRDAVRTHAIHIGQGRNINITISIGVSTFPDTVPDVNYLKEKADVALYTAKQSGRDKVCDFKEKVHLDI